MGGQGSEQVGVGTAQRSGTTEDDEVDRGQLVGDPAEALAHHPPQMAASNRLASTLLRDGEPESRFTLVRGTAEDGEAGVSGSKRAVEDPPELLLMSKPPPLREARGGSPIPVFETAQGIRRARPLARRAASTLRPLRVDMRARKP